MQPLLAVIQNADCLHKVVVGQQGCLQSAMPSWLLQYLGTRFASTLVVLANLSVPLAPSSFRFLLGFL